MSHKTMCERKTLSLDDCDCDKKYIVYYFPFKEGNEGKTPSQYPMLHDTEEEAESTKRFLTFHTAAISHVEHREPTPMEIVADVPYAAVRAIKPEEVA